MSLWLFTIWFGVTFSVGKDTSNSDQQRYFDKVEAYHSESWGLIEVFNNFSFVEQGDVFRHFSLWLISRFTDNGYIYLIFVAAILGYFYSHNVVYILRRFAASKNKALPWYIILLVACLFFAAPIDDIAGVRFINATHMALFGALPFIFEGKTTRLPMLIMSPLLFHFGMWIFIFAFFIAISIRFIASRFPKIILWSFLLSSLLSGFFQSEAVRFARSTQVIQGEFEFADRKTDAYLSDEKIQARKNVKIFGGSRNWYANLFPYAIRWSVICLLFITGFRQIYNAKSYPNYKKTYFRSFLLILLLFIVFNGLIGIPSINRFEAILNFLGLSYLLIYWGETRSSEIKSTMRWIWPATALFLLVSLRSAIYNLSFMTILGNPIIAVFSVGENVPINDTIKAILGF